MRRLLVILLFISIWNIGLSQKDKPLLVDFTPSECDANEDADRLLTRIIDYWFVGDTLLVEVGTKATCCVDFIPEIKFENDTLNLLFTETGSPCMCMCCYQFIYHIKGIRDENIGIKLQGKPIEFSEEKYLTYPVSFEILNGDTINYVDKYGFKQGLWFSKDDTTGSYFKAFAKDDEWQYRESIGYKTDGKVYDIYINHDYEASIFTKFIDSSIIDRHTLRNGDYFQSTKFYPNGVLKKLTITGTSEYFIWKEFYPNGKLRKERFQGDPENLWAKYYYDTGELMALFYVHKESEFGSPIHKWICYEKNGELIDLQKLVDAKLIEK